MASIRLNAGGPSIRQENRALSLKNALSHRHRHGRGAVRHAQLVVEARGRALEQRALMVAAKEYASRCGEPETTAYGAAWLRFHQRARATLDLQNEHREPPASNPDVIWVLNAAIQRAMLIDGASMANAQLLDPRQAGLRIVAHSGFTTEFLEFFALVDDTSSACGSALAARTPVWVTDTTRSPSFAATRALEVMLEAGSRAVASMPVAAPASRLIGMLSTHHTRPASWTDRRKQELQSSNSTGRLLGHFTATMPEGRRDLQLHDRSGGQEPAGTHRRARSLDQHAHRSDSSRSPHRIRTPARSPGHESLDHQ